MVKLAVVAPYDRTPIADVELADASSAEAALASAHALFRDRQRWLPAEARVEILRRAADAVAARRDELAVGASREGG
jgi:acyl-CoA reductase-like NAD-dependent aldehyde dehydrogenase